MRNSPVWPAWRQFLPHILVATDIHRDLIGVEDASLPPYGHWDSMSGLAAALASLGEHDYAPQGEE